MGSFKMNSVRTFDFSSLGNDSLCEDDGDDEISDDEVFIRDSQGNHFPEENGVTKPLMAPRKKINTNNNSKLHTHIRKVPSLRILLAPVCYVLICIAALTAIICLIFYLVHGFDFHIRSKTIVQEVEYSPCSNVNTEDVWTKTFPMLGTESAIRLVRLNEDDVSDVIVGFSTGVASYHYPKITCDIYFNGIEECGGGILALDGHSGSELWRHYTENEIFALNCNLDIDSDGISDCIGGGRVATLVAVSGRNGSRLWVFKDTVVGIERSNFYTPQYIQDVDGDGLGDIIVMHGGDPLKKPGEEHNLAARIIVLSSRSGKVIKWVKVPDGFESYYSPQVITRPDASQILLFGTGGETHGGSLWYISLKDILSGRMSMSRELYRDEDKGIMTPPALVDVTMDGIVDIVMSMFNSTVIAFDGITFERIWNFTFTESESYSTPGVGFFNDDKIPDLIVNYQRGPGFPVYYYSQTTVLNGKDGNPLLSNPMKSSIAVQSSPLVAGMQGFGNDAFFYWMSDCHGFENSSLKFDFFKGTSIHKETRVNLCQERYNTTKFYSRLYLMSHRLGQPGALIYDSDERKDLEYSGNLNYSEIGSRYLKKNPGVRELYEAQMNELYGKYDTSDEEELGTDFNDEETVKNGKKTQYPYSESQRNVKYPEFHNVRKHGRYGQDRTWDLNTSPKSNGRHRNPRPYPDENAYSHYYKDYDMNNREYPAERNWPSDYEHRRQRYHQVPNPTYQYNTQSNGDFYKTRRRWPPTGKHRTRYKRHVGYHDGEGVQRLISTGTLAPSLDNNLNDSIDVIFATYWFHPQKALTILPDDRKCIDDKMKNEKERFQKFKNMDHDEYEEKITIECLKQNGRYRPNMLEEPPYDPFNISMGMMTIYRLKISCKCAEEEGDVKACAGFLPWERQGWPSYMGRFGDSHFIPRSNYL